jgi:DNA-binding NarL/FixJ family response regulator
VIRVVIADDQALLRGSFRVLVDSEPDLAVVGEAATGVEAVSVAMEQRPDVVLMDVRMPEMDGIEATRRIKDVSRVLVVTMFDLDAYVYDALRAGASGFLLKDTPPADLLAAIRVVAGGEALLAPTVRAYSCRAAGQGAGRGDRAGAGGVDLDRAGAVES